MSECERCKQLEAQLAEAERLWEADRVAMRKAIAAAQIEYKRTAEARADGQLAWQRVTELQSRGTELVLERRAEVARLRRQLDAANMLATGFQDATEHAERKLVQVLRRLEGIMPELELVGDCVAYCHVQQIVSEHISALHDAAGDDEATP